MTKAAVATVLFAAWIAHAAPSRWLVSIGVDQGLAHEPALQYAARDAAGVAELFSSIGRVDPRDTVLLQQVDANAVLARLSELRARAEATPPDVLLVYVSSHASAGALHLEGTTLPVERLREAVNAVPAKLRVLVLDACASGSAVREKGVRLVPERTAPAVRGTIVLTSSGPAEPAQEWEALRGSLFTHHWLNGLRGSADVDLDGRVTVLESWTWARKQTLAQADQHPSWELDLSGSDDAVLTEPRRSPTALRLGETLSGRYVVAERTARGLVLECEKPAGEALVLAVPPGEYRISRRGAGRELAQVELRAGELRAVGPGDFVPEDTAWFAAKGSDRGVSGSVELAMMFSDGLVRLGTALTAWLLGDRAWGAFGVGVLGLDRTMRAELDLQLSLAAGLGGRLGPMRVGVGLVGRPLWLVRQGTNEGGEPVTRSGLGVEGGTQLWLEWQPAGPVFFGAQGEGLLRWSPLDRAVPLLGGRVNVVLGLQL